MAEARKRCRGSLPDAVNPTRPGIHTLDLNGRRVYALCEIMVPSSFCLETTLLRPRCVFAGVVHLVVERPAKIVGRTKAQRIENAFALFLGCPAAPNLFRLRIRRTGRMASRLAATRGKCLTIGLDLARQIRIDAAIAEDLEVANFGPGPTAIRLVSDVPRPVDAFVDHPLPVLSGRCDGQETANNDDSVPGWHGFQLA